MYKFPFDTQVCDVALSSLVNYDHVVNITSSQKYVNCEIFLENQEFRYGEFNHV